MIDILISLKKEIIILIIIKAFLVFALNLLEFYQISIFTGALAILNLSIIVFIPLIFLRIVSRKNDALISLKHFVLVGFIICFLSSFIRVFIFDAQLLNLVYDNWIYDSSIDAINTMSLTQRALEFIKFALFGWFVFIIVGIFKLIKR